MFLAGCGSDSGAPGIQDAEVEGFPANKSTAIVQVIDLQDVSYLREDDKAALDSTCGGLIVWPDLDSDGTDDVVIAAAHGPVKGRQDTGYVEAWSAGRGERIWQVRGELSVFSGPGKVEAGYTLGQIARITDVDGDGVDDIYCLADKPRQTELIISGKAGRVLEKRTTDRQATYKQPIRVDDANGDGAADLWFWSPRTSSVVIHSILGGEHLLNAGPIWPGIPESQTVTIALPRFYDVTGDGIDDMLIRRNFPPPGGGRYVNYEMAIIDGKDFRLIRTFQTPMPRVGGEIEYAKPGDVTGDSQPDIVMASSTGEGPKNSTSFLQLTSGADGTIVWKTLGDLPGGQQRFSVDVKTGQRTELPADIGLGNPVLIAPDANGDGIPDLATVCLTKDGIAGALFVFSGRDGKLIGTLSPETDHVRLIARSKSQLGLLPRFRNGRPGIAAAAQDKRGKTAIVLFELPTR